MHIFDRVKNILVTPRSEFSAVRAEYASVQQIFTQYLLIVAALPALGYLLSFSRYRLFGFDSSLRMAVVTYIVTLASTYVTAYVVDYLATNFGATRNLVNSLKLVAYSATPWMVAGLLSFVPVLHSLITLVGAAYSLYLLYLGLPILKDTTQDRTVPYLIAIIVVSLIVYFILFAILMPIFGLTMSVW